MKRPQLSHVWDRHPDDWYVEPEWCSKRLFEDHKFSGVIVDPACGMGNILNSARSMGFDVLGMDIAARTDQIDVAVNDFLADGDMLFDNIVSNPPFKHCDASADFLFVKRCLDRAADQVALLLPAGWIGGDERSRWLETTPLEFVYWITPRPSMPPGTVIEAGERPGQGKKDYAWYVWRQGYRGDSKNRWLRRYPVKASRGSRLAAE